MPIAVQGRLDGCVPELTLFDVLALRDEQRRETIAKRMKTRFPAKMLKQSTVYTRNRRVSKPIREWGGRTRHEGWSGPAPKRT
jgi:hypothetical protein